MAEQPSSFSLLSLLGWRLSSSCNGIWSLLSYLLALPLRCPYVLAGLCSFGDCLLSLWLHQLHDPNRFHLQFVFLWRKQIGPLFLWCPSPEQDLLCGHLGEWDCTVYSLCSHHHHYHTCHSRFLRMYPLHCSKSPQFMVGVWPAPLVALISV